MRLTGALPAWVSAKDVTLEMLRSHRVAGGVNRIVEYRAQSVIRRPGPFSDVEADVCQCVARIKASPFIPHTEVVGARVRLPVEEGTPAGVH